MWTKAHRARHEPRLKEVVSMQAAGEVARWLERADPPKSVRRTPARQVVPAVIWHLRVGGAWRALPEGFPNWRTVYGRFRHWLAGGLFDALLRAVAHRRRRDVGRRSEPRLCIIDTQTVKCLGVGGPRGYDAGKKVLGRKRVALVDAAGHVLAIAVVPACVQDRDALQALTAAKVMWPSLRVAIFDAAFAAERCRIWSHLHGMSHRIAARDPAAKGFVVVARRWVAERSFGWLSHWDGLVRDRAGRLDVSAGRYAFAAAASGVEAVLNPVPLQNEAA